MGVEILAAAVVAYLIRKAARVGRRADQEVDQALDAGMDILHDLVSTKLRGDLALARLEQQAVTGDASERTQRRAADAIADAAEDDPDFASQLEHLVKALANREVSVGGSPPTAVQNLIGGGSQGVVIMGGSISHVTVHNPAPPSTPNPIRNEEKERQERARDAAYQRFLTMLPKFRPRSVQLRRVRRNVYSPEGRAYAVADVNEMLNEVRRLIAAKDLSGLSAYLAAVGLNRVTETSQPDMALSEGLAVDVYLNRLRDALKACFTEVEDY